MFKKIANNTTRAFKNYDCIPRQKSKSNDLVPKLCEPGVDQDTAPDTVTSGLDLSTEPKVMVLENTEKMLRQKYNKRQYEMIAQSIL